MERIEPHGLTGSIEKDGYLAPEQQLQLEAIQDKTALTLLEAIKSRKPGELYPMAAMATGFGKGRIIHKVITSTLQENPNAKILVIAGTKSTLVEQTHSSLLEHQGRDQQFDNSYIEAEEDDELVDETTEVDLNITGEQSLVYETGKYGSNANVEIATIQKVQSEAKKDMLDTNKYDLVIVDEVHNIGTPQRKSTIDKFEKVVGFTATAYRHTGSMKQPEDYGFRIFESLPLPQAQEMGFLPPLIGMQIDTKGLVENIPISPSGKIDYSQLEKILKNSPDLLPYIADRLSTILMTESGVYKTTIAVNYVEEAQELGRLLKEKGFKVGLAINKQAAKQTHSDQIPTLDSIERYKLPKEDSRAIDVLISPYVASEGFDAPATEVLVWASPTDSPVRYTQYTGRLARRSPGKAFGVIVDCLYQTTQFNYSYNLAMWMKENVVQLDNGLLYLGPEYKIQDFKNSNTHQQFAKEQGKIKDSLSFEDLTNEPIIPLQDNETALTSSFLLASFIGNTSKLGPLHNAAVDIIKSYYPTYFKRRIRGGRPFLVANDIEKYFEVMQDLGAEPRESILPLQPGEIHLSQKYLYSKFIGSNNIQRIAAEALQIIAEYYPDIYPTRLSTKGQRIFATSDESKFIEVMQDFGLQLQDHALPIQPGEIALNHDLLNSTFLQTKKLPTLHEQTIEILRDYYPELFPIRRNTSRRFIAASDIQKYLEVMLDLGAELSGSTLSLQPSETALIQTYLRKTFIGNAGSLRPLHNQAIEIIREYYPELLVTRLSGTKEVTATLDPSKYLEVMRDLGVKLRNPQ